MIVKLLLGFYEPQKGQIVFAEGDGLETPRIILSDINPHLWRKSTGAVLQEGISFSKVGLLMHPVKIMEYVYVPMLVSASKISDEITQAAITRGIDHVGRRSSLETVEFRIWDVVFITVYIGIIALVVFDLVRGGVLI